MAQAIRATKETNRGAGPRRIASAALLAVAVSLAGFAPATAQDGGAPDGAAPDLLRAPLSPVPPTLSRADVDVGIGLLDEIVTDAMTATGVPGVAVAVVYEDEVVALKGFGVREAGRPEPVDADTVFKVASVSKPIAATVAAGLVGQGLFAFDDPVIGSNPAFELSEPYVTQNATFADLLSHRSGLATGAGDFLEDLGFDRDTILSRLSLEPLDAFRSTHNYSNYGYTAGGEAAARAAGKSFEAVADEVLFEPLGMTRTSFRHADYLAHENRARIHVETAPGSKVWEARFERNADAQAPAGGAASSIADMARFVRLQLGGGTFDGVPVIDEVALATTHMPHSFRSPRPSSVVRPRFYGLGWDVATDDDGRVVLSHSGAFTLGTATNIVLVPGENLGVVVLTNAAPIGVAEAIGATFVDIAEHGVQTVDWLPLFAGAFAQMAEAERAEAVALMPTGDPGEKRPLEAYAGIYDNAYFGPAIVAVAGEGLSLVMGPETAPVTIPLTHEAGDHFRFETFGEWATGDAVAAFGGTVDGKAAQLTLSAYDMRGLGTFTRR